MIDRISECRKLMDDVARNKKASAANQEQVKMNNTFFDAYEKTLLPIMRAYVLVKQYSEFKFSDDSESALKECLKQTQIAFNQQATENVKQYSRSVANLNALMKNEWLLNAQQKNIRIRAELASLKLIYSKPETISNYSIHVNKFESWPITEAAIKQYNGTVTATQRLRQSMQLDQAIDDFLTKVSKQEATILDLTPDILTWISQNGLKGHFKLSIG